MKGNNMERKVESLSYTLKQESEIGDVKIANDVVAMIAGIAATEVPGVSAMVGNVGNNILAKIGYKNLTKGVRVDINNGKVKLDLAIVVEYGNNIPAVSSKVQEKVKSTVESMTGLNATDVNVRIAGVTEG